MRPSEVLDAQIDLLTRLQHNPPARGYIGHAFAGDMARKGDAADSDQIATVLTNHVRGSHAYRVTHDMCAMVEWMAGQFDDLDRFMPDLAPTGCGFVSFDKPLPIVDARGRTLLMHFLVWGPAYVGVGNRAEQTVALWAFNDLWRQPDEMMAEIQALKTPEEFAKIMRFMGRWATVGLNGAFNEQRLGPQSRMPVPEHAAEILADGGTPVPGTNTLRYVHALWLLLGQTMVDVADDDLDRPARRRAGKAKLPPKVSVIRLRRRETLGARPEGESLVQWTHRWIVRQHWRWAPYGPRKHVEHAHEYGPVVVERGGLVRRCVVGGCENYLGRIIIAMHEKGPEDAPLIQSEKVYSLDR